MLIAYAPSGQTCDFFAFDSAGNVWQTTTSTFVAWVDANYANYRIAATEVGTSGRFTAVEPTGTATYSLRLRAGTLAGSAVFWTDAISASGGAAITIDNDAIEITG